MAVHAAEQPTHSRHVAHAPSDCEPPPFPPPQTSIPLPSTPSFPNRSRHADQNRHDNQLYFFYLFGGWLFCTCAKKNAAAATIGI